MPRLNREMWEAQLALSALIGRLGAVCRPRPELLRTICCWCKRQLKPAILVDAGHGGTSHGICPECSARMYPEMAA
jgi:hypothetical protein